MEKMGKAKKKKRKKKARISRKGGNSVESVLGN